LRKLTLGSLKTLRYLDCSNNKLTELDTSNCPRIEKLICDGNQLNQENIVQNLQSELERERTKTKFLMSQLEEKKSKTNEPQLSSEKNKHHSVKYIKKTFFFFFQLSHTLKFIPNFLT
jgi:Leucine-rich repeat (LRR) protein